jgi:predicted MFS family arabinose efflux permease
MLRTVGRMNRDQPMQTRIMSPAVMAVFVASFGALASFYLLLSVVPMYAGSVGAGGVGGGLATGALMLSTVAAELATPALVSRCGNRPVFAAGLLLLGAPTLALPAASNLSGIMAVCVVRGLGFAIVVVVGGALVAALVPEERRGEGLGLYGVVVGVPAVIMLPLGVWLAGRAGFPSVFAAAAVAALGGLVVVRGLPGKEPVAEKRASVLAGLRSPALFRPALAFSATTMAAGVVVAFLPLALTRASGNLAALALLIQAVAATLARWWAGRYGDRNGPARQLMPGVLVAAAGMLALVLTTNTAAVLTGMALFGVGFGMTQNASLTLMFSRASTSEYGTVSAVWNLAYDAGLGAGAAGFGVVAAQTGYPVAFALTATLVLGGLAPAWRDRMATRRSKVWGNAPEPCPR